MIIALTALIIVVLLGVIVTVVHYSYLSAIQTELQLTADSAALAAAGRLNSTTGGWLDAREAAIKLLAESKALSSLGGNTALTLDPNQDGSLWDLSDSMNLRVRIERGVWRPPLGGGLTYISGSGLNTFINGTPAQFVSYEEDWQDENPGIPAFIAANAVRISIERPRTRIFGSPFGESPEYAPKAESIALRGPVEPVCVAPFAFPVCALVDKRGEYYGTNNCKSDRYFARSDRFCPADSSPESCNTSTAPSVPYTPIDFSTLRDVNVDAQNINYLRGVEDELPEEIESPDWDLRIEDPDAHLLWKDDLPTFRELMPKPDTTSSGPFSIGLHGFFENMCNFLDTPPAYDYAFVRPPVFTAPDYFGVVGLPGGTVTDNALESQIVDMLGRGPGSVDACRPAQIGDQFNILADGLTSSAEENLVWDVIRTPSGADVPGGQFTASVLYSESPMQSMERRIDAMFVEKPRLFALCPAREQRFRGLCNSRRGQYEIVGPAPRFFEGRGIESFLMAFKLFPNVDDQVPVWKTKVPVIAEEGAGAGRCQTESISRDPKIVPGHRYIIIGFVDVYIHDLDVGRPPPAYPIGTVNGVTALFPEPIRFPQPCNIVQSRVGCESKFVPSSASDGFATPRLAYGRVEEDS